MRRGYLLAGLSAAVVAGLAVLIIGPFSVAESVSLENKAGGKSQTAAQLPITKVVLFSSGVGYFQRSGQVEGTQRIDLSFQEEDINDLLKSMTLQDLDGGTVTAVSYDNNAPIDRTLQSYAINLSGNPTYANILNQARGEKVEVILQTNNAAQPANLTGTLMGMEMKQIKVNKEVVNAEMLNLWCADGMRSIKVDEVQRVRFLNTIMDNEIRKALETVSLGHDSQQKSVNIQFTGEGKRQVRVGYVVESPIWKTSYRMVLSKEEKKGAEKLVGKDQKDANKPFLQSWAIVENPTDEDWTDVQVALISGRPISFQMNLYDPLYIKRPTVEPELFASLRPPTYEGGMGDKANQGWAGRPGVPPSGGEGFGGGFGGGFAGGGAGAGAPGGYPGEGKKSLADRRSRTTYGRGLEKQEAEQLAKRILDEDLNLRQGVQSAAQASKLGDYYRYVIDHSITLPRQKSAMLPILNQDIEAERVSIFNEGVHNKFPLLGLHVKNTTGVPLTQGPVTIFEGSNYAGDARIPQLQKDEKRLISYAIDLGTEVQAVNHPQNGMLTNVKIVKGIIHSTTKQREKKTYKITNRNEETRSMVIEHPNRTDFTITSEAKPWESARDVHRFRVSIPAGKTEELDVVEEKELHSQITLSNANTQSIRVMLDSKITSEKVKETLKDAMTRRNQVAEGQRDLTKARQQLSDLYKDQEQLSQRLKVLPKESATFTRFVKRIDEQQTDIEKIQEEIKTLEAKVNTSQRELDQYLSNLTVE